MKDHEGDIREFRHLSRAWYGEANLANADFVDEVSFGFYSPDGGTSGEMSVKWFELGSDRKPAACLRCFDDAFHALGEFVDVIKRLADVGGQNIQPPEFCQLLIECGFKDETPEQSPYYASPDKPTKCPTCGAESPNIAAC